MNRSTEAIGCLFIGILGLAATAVFIWLFGAQFWHGLWSAIRSNMLPLTLGAIAAIMVALIVMLASGHIDSGLTGGFIAGAIVALITTMPVHGHYVPSKVAEATIEQPAEALDFRQRTPYDVAKAVSNRNLGDTTGDASGGVKAIPTANEHGVYTTTVIRRGMFKGYESTQTNEPPLYGSTSAANVQFCDFNENAKLRLGGMAPSNNLKRAIQWKTSPSTLIDRADVVVQCEDDVPMVYVPTTQLSSDFFMPHRVPGPVAVYNGHTGELAVHDSIESDLPLYPSSLATQQREALTALGGFWDTVFIRAGYVDTSKDEHDPNGENRAEFTLADGTGETAHYVTPLTKPGSSSSIVALGTLEASGQQQAGQLREYTVHQYPAGESRQANSAIASRITGEVLSGYMASGLKVFEVVPSEAGTWVATVGKEQSVLYRAVIHPEGNIDLLDAQGNEVAGGHTSDDTAEDLTADKPLQDMTPEELQQLGNQILAELAERTATN